MRIFSSALRDISVKRSESVVCEAACRQRCDASLHKGKKITIFTESMLSHNSCRLAYDFYHFVFVQ